MEIIKKCFSCRDKNGDSHYSQDVYADNANQAKSVHVSSMYDDATYITTVCKRNSDMDKMLFEGKTEFRYNIVKILLQKEWRESLNRLKCQTPNANCRIWSGQWSAWWRSGNAGYTNNVNEAGIFSVSEAYNAVHHCGIEKKISLQLI